MHAPVAAVKNETTPITELNQQRASMKRPDEETGFRTPCPLALRSAAACTRTGTGTRARSRPAPRACPEHYTPPLPRRQGQLRRVDRRNRQVLQLNDWAAHMRLAHSYSEPKYVVTMRAHLYYPLGAHIAVAVRSAEAGGRSFEVDHLSHMGKCDLYSHHITVRKYHKRA